jgi:hypothetical protein
MVSNVPGYTHRINGSAAGGFAANFGTEVYTRVVVRRA